MKKMDVQLLVQASYVFKLIVAMIRSNSWNPLQQQPISIKPNRIACNKLEKPACNKPFCPCSKKTLSPPKNVVVRKKRGSNVFITWATSVS